MSSLAGFLQGSWFPGPILGLSSEEQWLVQGLVPLLGSLLPGLNPLQPAFLDAVLAPGLARYGGASAGPAKAQLLCLPVAFPCMNPSLLPAVWELVPSLFVSSPALGPFLWGDADSLLGRLRDLWLGLPGPFGLCLLWRRREVYGVLESMAFAVFRGQKAMGELRASLLRCRRCGGVLPAALEAVAVAVHFQDMDVVGEPVQQRSGEPLRAEHVGPLVKRQVGGDQAGDLNRQGLPQAVHFSACRRDHD